MSSIRLPLGNRVPSPGSSHGIEAKDYVVEVQTFVQSSEADLDSGRTQPLNRDHLIPVEVDGNRSSGEVANLDLAGRELVEFDVLEVAIQLAVVADLAGRAGGFQVAVVEQDHAVA